MLVKMMIQQFLLQQFSPQEKTKEKLIVHKYYIKNALQTQKLIGTYKET